MDESWGKFQELKGECSDLDEQNDGGDDDKNEQIWFDAYKDSEYNDDNDNSSTDKEDKDDTDEEHPSWIILVHDIALRG